MLRRRGITPSRLLTLVISSSFCAFLELLAEQDPGQIEDLERHCEVVVLLFLAFAFFLFAALLERR